MELHQTKLAAEQTELRLKQVEGEARAREDQLQQLKCKVDNRWCIQKYELCCCVITTTLLRQGRREAAAAATTTFD